ncbi:MAG: hypothetical protein IH941_13355 [Acidobacteria bacterium]|nr:hypothetical protein [Acidobacteriota bacterium]MCH8993152.1 hypothetical protein [Acidobacteriota bacterium]
MKRNRLQTVGIVLTVIGLLFMVAAGVAYSKVQDGYSALDAFSTAENVTLSYNDDGQLIDRGTTEGADAIMALLTDDWGFNVNKGDLDPNDPIVNTATEFMFQMATIGFHVLNGTQTVVLTEDVEYNGELFAAGTYEFEVDGRYWTDFNRSHPIEGPARSQAWSGTVHGLFGELGVGTVTHSVLQIGLAIAAAFGAIGGMAILTGLGLVWVSREEKVGELDVARERAEVTV